MCERKQRGQTDLSTAVKKVRAKYFKGETRCAKQRNISNNINVTLSQHKQHACNKFKQMDIRNYYAVIDIYDWCILYQTPPK